MGGQAGLGECNRLGNNSERSNFCGTISGGRCGVREIPRRQVPDTSAPSVNLLAIYEPIGGTDSLLLELLN